MVLIELAPEAPSVLAVQEEVECILLELALRARQAMPRGGRLAVWLEVDPADVPVDALPAGGGGGVLRVRMRDSGPGLSAERSDSDAVTDPGLGIVRGLVERGGGSICLHSVVGEGTTVDLYWPVLQEGVRADASDPAGGSNDRN